MDNVFHTQDNLFFARNKDGSVTILKTDPASTKEEPKVLFQQTLDKGSWASVVLSMTAFNERSGDWHAWMKHHMGEEDILRKTQ